MRRVTATVCALLALGACLPGLAQAKTRFTLIGHGFGHGVGMSQYGALGDAEHGWKFDRILAHYYQGTTLGAAPTPQTSERVLLTADRTSINVSAASPIQFVDEGGTTNVTLPSGHYGIRPGTNPGRIQVVDLESPSQPQVLHGLFGPVVAHPTKTNLVLHNSAGIGFRDDHWRGFFRVIETNHRVECINVVPVESYVAGVVPNEVPASWPQATLRAQAIAARSYAYRAQPRGNFDVYSDTRSQAYGPVEREQPQATAAATATAGMYVLYKGAVATTLFSSSSGGRTSSEQVAFGGDVGQPYLVPVNDPYDAAGGANPNHTWKPVVYTPAGLAADVRVRQPGQLDRPGGRPGLAARAAADPPHRRRQPHLDRPCGAGAPGSAVELLPRLPGDPRPDAADLAARTRGSLHRPRLAAADRDRAGTRAPRRSGRLEAEPGGRPHRCERALQVRRAAVRQQGLPASAGQRRRLPGRPRHGSLSGTKGPGPLVPWEQTGTGS